MLFNMLIDQVEVMYGPGSMTAAASVAAAAAMAAAAAAVDVKQQQQQASSTRCVTSLWRGTAHRI
jgi:hypothetical protein